MKSYNNRYNGMNATLDEYPTKRGTHYVITVYLPCAGYEQFRFVNKEEAERWASFAGVEII